MQGFKDFLFESPGQKLVVTVFYVPSLLSSGVSQIAGAWNSDKRFRRGLAFQAHRFFYHSTLGLRVIKKKRRFKERRLRVSMRFLPGLQQALPISVRLNRGSSFLWIY